MRAAVGRMASRTLRWTETQVVHGKDKVSQADQALEVETRIQYSVQKGKVNLSEVKVTCWGIVENKLI